METHGGGGILVYSYTFTHYNSFEAGSNAVTPRPNWPASNDNVPISTTPPLSESSLGALDWNVWKDFGEEFMVRSTVNDWIVCQPNGGSIVSTLQCCFFYYLEGDTDDHWPAHDPCRMTKADHKKGVSNPGGQIYLR